MCGFTVEQGEYKGNKTISLMKDEKRVFSCGVKKAQAIVANIEALKEFVAANTVEEVNE